MTDTELRWIISLATSAGTIVSMWAAGSKRWWGWLVGVANQAVWLLFIIKFRSWGLLPLSAALVVIYGRNALRWRTPPAEPIMPAVEVVGPPELDDYLNLIETERDSRPAEAMLADEIARLRLLCESDISVEEMEVKIRDGQLLGHMMTKKGDPAMRLVGALLLNVLLGDDDEYPPNYRSFEMMQKPAGKFENQAIRVYAEVIKPGGKTSHQIRADLEAEVARLEKRLEEACLADIAARNPGIDIDEVRAHRAAQPLPQPGEPMMDLLERTIDGVPVKGRS